MPHIPTSTALEMAEEHRQMTEEITDLKGRVEGCEDVLRVLRGWIGGHPEQQAMGKARDWALSVIGECLGNNGKDGA